MTIPDFQTLMRPLLNCGETQVEVKTSDCIEILAEKFGLTIEEKEDLLPSGRQPIFLIRFIGTDVTS